MVGYKKGILYLGFGRSIEVDHRTSTEIKGGINPARQPTQIFLSNAPSRIAVDGMETKSSIYLRDLHRHLVTSIKAASSILTRFNSLTGES